MTGYEYRMPNVENVLVITVSKLGKHLSISTPYGVPVREMDLDDHDAARIGWWFLIGVPDVERLAPDIFRKENDNENDHKRDPASDG